MARHRTYYVGACVDPVPGELNTANNCTSAFRMTVVASDDVAGAWQWQFDGHASDSPLEFGINPELPSQAKRIP